MPSEINPIGRLTVIKDGNVFGQTMDINLEEFTFGRDKDVDIRIVKDYVAPKALKLVCAGGKAYVINTSDKPGQIMVNKIEVPLRRKQVLKSGDVFSICERNFRFDYYDNYRPHDDEDSATVLQALDQCRTPPTSSLSSTTPLSKTKENETKSVNSSSSKGRRSPRFSDDNITTTNMNDSSILNQSMVKDQTIILKNMNNSSKSTVDSSSTKENNSFSQTAAIIRTPKAIRPTVGVTPSRNSIDNTNYLQLLGALNANNVNSINKPIATSVAPKSVLKKSPSATTSTTPKAEDIPTPVRISIQTLRSGAIPKIVPPSNKKSPVTPMDSSPLSSSKSSTPLVATVTTSASKRRSPSPSPLPTLITSNTSPVTTPPATKPGSVTKSNTPASSTRKNTPTNGPMSRGSPLSLMTAPTPLRAKSLTTVKDHHHRTPAKSALKKSVIKMLQEENNMVLDDPVSNNNTGSNNIVPSFPSFNASPPGNNTVNSAQRALPTPIRTFIHKKRKSITFGHSHAALIPPKEDNRHFLLDDDNRNSDIENKVKTDDDEETSKNTKLNSIAAIARGPEKATKASSPVNSSATITSLNTMNNTFAMGIAPTNRFVLLESINKRRKSYGSSLPPGKTLPPPEDTHLHSLPTKNSPTKDTTKPLGKLTLPSPLRRQIANRRTTGESTTDNEPTLADILTKVNTIANNKKLATATSVSSSSSSSTTLTSSSKPTKPVVSLGNELAKALQARRAKIDPTETTRSSPRTVTKGKSPVSNANPPVNESSTLVTLPTLITTTTSSISSGRKFTLPSPLTRQITSRRKSVGNTIETAISPVSVTKVPIPATKSVVVSPKQAIVPIPSVVRGIPTPLKRSIELRRKSIGVIKTPGKASTHTKFVDEENDDNFSPLLPGQRMHMKFSDSGRIISKTKVRNIVANDEDGDNEAENVDNEYYDDEDNYEGDEDVNDVQEPLVSVAINRRKSVGPKNSHVIFTSPTDPVPNNHLIFTSPTEKTGNGLTPKSVTRTPSSGLSTNKSASKVLLPLETNNTVTIKALPTPVRQAIQAKRKSLTSLPTVSPSVNQSPNPSNTQDLNVIRKALPTPLRTAINNKRKSFGTTSRVDDIDDEDTPTLTPIGKVNTPKGTTPKANTPKTTPKSSSITPVVVLSSGKKSTKSVTPASSGKRSQRSYRSIPEVDNEEDDDDYNLNESLPVEDEDEEEERIPGPWDNESDPRYHRGNRSIIYARSEARLSTVMESDNEEEEERLRLLQESMYDDDDDDHYSAHNRRGANQRNGRMSISNRRRQTGTPKRRSITIDQTTPLSSITTTLHAEEPSSNASNGRRTSISKTTTPGSTTLTSSSTPVNSVPNDSVIQKSTGKKYRKSVTAVPTEESESEAEAAVSTTAAGTKKGKGKTIVVAVEEPVMTKGTRGTKRKEVESVEETKPVKAIKPTKKAKVVEAVVEESEEEVEEEETPCNVCGKLKPALVIGCDGPCNAWYHPKCVGLSKAPTTDDDWYCPTCTEAKESVSKKRSKTTSKKDEIPSLNIDDLPTMKVAELREAAESRGLDSTGTKAVLINFLTEALQPVKGATKKKGITKVPVKTEDTTDDEDDAPPVGSKRGRTGIAKVAELEPITNKRNGGKTTIVTSTTTTKSKSKK